MSGGNDYLIAANGTIYPLRDLGVQVVGLGDIPAQYIADQGYKQHGLTMRDYRMAQRSLTFTFGLYARTPMQLWQARQSLFAALSPQVGVVTYRKVLPSGARRDIQGWIQAGMTVETVDGRSADVAFSLECFDPAFYDPAPRALTLQVVEIPGFTLPFTVPFYFWGDTELTAALVNPGTWRSYPTMTITGPYSRLILTNATTGASFTLGVALNSEDSIEIDLTPGAQSVTRSGSSALHEIESGNLLDWYIAPGANQVIASGSGLSSDTQIVVSYRPRYIAI